MTDHFDKYLQTKVESGRYQSASEVVREGLRLLENRDREQARAELRDDIEAGWQQSQRGQLVDGPATFDEIRRLSKTRRSQTAKPKARG